MAARLAAPARLALHPATGVAGRAATVRTDRLAVGLRPTQPEEDVLHAGSDIRITLARLSERAAAESRKCCAMATRERTDRDLAARILPEVQAEKPWWQLIHKAAPIRPRQSPRPRSTDPLRSTPKNADGVPAARPEVFPANAACSATHDLTDADPPSQPPSPECCDDQLNPPNTRPRCIARCWQPTA